jgi:hypothetical protein
MLIGAAVALGAAGLFGHAPRLHGESSPDDLVGFSTEASLWYSPVGQAGCASAACHGGSSHSLTGRRDFRSWNGATLHCFATDPHNRAFAALETPLAASIMRDLGSGISATQDERCLACHTNPALANRSAEAREIALRREGVGCEGCHGNAEQWLHGHTSWTPENRGIHCDQSGMTKLYDLGERALACAGCHVGAPADPSRGYPVRDMNHDMIAAGHPRLSFDFADSQRRLPPHWFETDRSSGFELRSWLVGRAAHGEAACRLRDDRGTRTPRPEFADFSCVSCHHPLDSSFPRKEGKLNRETAWPMDDAAGLDALVKLRRRLGKASNAEIEQIAASAFHSAEALPTMDRDLASQIYFGLAARERSQMLSDGRSGYPEKFDRLAKELRLPRGSIDFRVSSEARSLLQGLLGEGR